MPTLGSSNRSGRRSTPHWPISGEKGLALAKECACEEVETATKRSGRAVVSVEEGMVDPAQMQVTFGTGGRLRR